MHYVHNLNPVALEWEGMRFHWYWLFYLCGLLWVFYSGHRLAESGRGKLRGADFGPLCLLCWVAMLLGSRLFYVLVYQGDYFWQNPHVIVKFWAGGMSFHGGLLGVAVAAGLGTRWRKVSGLALADILATVVPLALMLGRVGNFINGELAGRVSELPWAVVFPRFYDLAPRHPSQLYAAAVEGLGLFILLYRQRKYLAIPGHQSLLFLLGYGLGRFMVGFFRAPDPQLGLYWSLSVGQIFSLAMVGAACCLELRYAPLRLRLKKDV